MPRIWGLTTMMASLIGMIIAMSWINLPVKANEAELFQEFIRFSEKTEDFKELSSSRASGNSLKNIVGITGLGIGTAIIAWHLAREEKTSVLKYLPRSNQENRSLLDQVNPQLRRELLRLVNDKTTVNRLLSGTLNSHTSRSANWLAEKSDL